MNATATEQQQHLQRVSGNIAGFVREFLRATRGADFHDADLVRYVLSRTCCCPSSPGRILREMKRKQEVRVVLVSRSRSLYRQQDPELL